MCPKFVRQIRRCNRQTGNLINPHTESVKMDHSMRWVSYSVKITSQSTYPCPGVNLRTVTQEDTDYICLVGPGSQMKRRFAPDCWHIGACIML